MRDRGNGTEEAPPFSCLFALRGTLAGGSAAVTVWSPPDTATTSGMLTLAGDTFRLKLQGEPPGCAATGDDFVSAPLEDSSVKSGTWTSARLVSAPTADVHEAPVDGSSRKAMLSKGDVVVIYRHIGAWLEAEFFGGKHPVRGWVRESDLAPDHP